MGNLIEKVLEDLKEDLDLSDESDVKTLKAKVKKAVMEIRVDRGYPSRYTEEMILADLDKFYSNIYDLALYDYNQVGAEGQASHSENGISRAWKSRRECKDGVISFCNSL